MQLCATSRSGSLASHANRESLTAAQHSSRGIGSTRKLSSILKKGIWDLAKAVMIAPIESRSRLSLRARSALSADD
jgi:hypothetical protein